jgi:hypothetical protein
MGQGGSGHVPRGKERGRSLPRSQGLASSVPFHGTVLASVPGRAKLWRGGPGIVAETPGIAAGIKFLPTTGALATASSAAASPRGPRPGPAGDAVR